MPKTAEDNIQRSSEPLKDGEELRIAFDWRQLARELGKKLSTYPPLLLRYQACSQPLHHSQESENVTS